MFVLENSHLYNVHEMQHAALAPIRAWAQWTKYWVNMPGNPLACTEFGRTVFATCELTERVTRRYTKPKFAFTPFEANGEQISVKEKIAKKNPFCFLKHFRHTTKKNLPKLLIVAPLSGHYATLLRGTVFSMLPYYDVYITDWIDAREVPLVHGSFDFDD